MRVLVTGGTGVIGRAVVPLLTAAGYEIHTAQRSAAAFDATGVRAHRADLLDPWAIDELLERVRPTHLLHLAWFTRQPPVLDTAENLAWVDASLHLLERFTASGGRRAVVAGTAQEALPATVYGGAKRDLFERATARDGGALAWGRIFFAYGPGESSERLLPSLVRGLLAGEAVDLSHGRQRRDFVFVDDVAAALAAMVDSEMVGATDIGTGETPTVREVAETVAACIGAEPELLRFGAVPPDDGPPVWVADPARLREEVGWEPRVSLVEGIERVVSWWRRRS